MSTSTKKAVAARSAVRRGAREGQQTARRAKTSPIARALPSIGLSARATAYMILGGIVTDILLGAYGKQASSTGAFELVTHQPAGPVLLSGLALGLVAYSLWRFLQAAADEQQGPRLKHVLRRLGHLAIGSGYLVLAYEAVRVVVSGNGNETSSNTTPLSRTLLEHTGGQFLLGALGTGIAAGGIGLLLWAGSQRFSRYLHLRARPKAVEVGGHIVETFGQGTRGAVLTAIGVSLVVAAVQNMPHDSKGLDTALLDLAGHAQTRWLVGVIAAGMFAFGIASVVEAVYREP
jgi:Domain of Unknown Function (DUF1206)